MFHVSPKLTTKHASPALPGKSLAKSQVQLYLVLCLGPTGISLEAINKWLPPVLGLEVPREAKPQTKACCY